MSSSSRLTYFLYFWNPLIEEGDRRQETGDRRKITWGFSPQVILNTV
ncbi:hypothetical protein [Okeania sp. SIO1H4]|nr:hypothetical protein [Okeania sp. SIO1H4]NES77227.1 hypothetical protein [Okeania sp. SIO1H4]